MAVQFEFYKNPGTGEEGEEEQYHPRVVNFNSVSTEYLAAEIHRATTFGEAEVEGVLMSLSHFMSSHLKNGERVHLKGIGAAIFPTGNATFNRIGCWFTTRRKQSCICIAPVRTPICLACEMGDYDLPAMQGRNEAQHNSPAAR